MPPDEYDKDGGGSLDVKELLPGLQGLWDSFACSAPPPSMDDCKEVLEQFDCDGDGVIEKSEFQCFCKVPPRQHACRCIGVHFHCYVLSDLLPTTTLPHGLRSRIVRTLVLAVAHLGAFVVAA